jgi:EAL domain-containing protein (putative c-di-GMP-specific phosphodiesterase class I)/CheY-like chemotaxis protein
VLVVDDDRAVRGLIAATLDGTGLVAVEAATGEDALACLAERRFAAVVLDVGLPGMSGIDVLTRIRSEPATETLPVLLVTGAGDLDARVRGLQAGATDYVVKPFEPDELVARLRSHLRSQAAWARTVESHLRHRTNVAATLARVDTDAPPERVATDVCRRLLSLPDIAGVAVIAFVADGVAVTLATDGMPVPSLAAGRPLPARTAHRLASRAARGPWAERLGGDGPTLPATPVDAGAPVAFAPLRHGRHVTGLLVLLGGGTTRDAGWHASGTFAAAMDLAGVVGAILAPAIRRHHRRAQAARLMGVVRANAFRCVFQPIVRLTDLETVGYEALTRFADGTRPDARFSEASSLGMGAELEVATMTAAVEAARSLPDRSWLSLNVSPDVLVGTQEVANVLARVDRPVVLELTEHDPIEDYDAVRRAVESLPSDVRISVDDAGSGFASLRHVINLRPDFMKLDRSWVAGLEADLARQALVAGLAHFASRTDCTLIAEGVERDEELGALRELAAELGQGFLLGRPERAGV